MKCGHIGPAVGAPGSPARDACEQSECIDCVRAKLDEKLIAMELMLLMATPEELPMFEAEYQKLLKEMR